jgi:hypothetical protein
VDVPKVSFVQIAIAIFLTFFFVLPGLPYYRCEHDAEGIRV